MAVGSYGIVRPADVSPDDVEILYHYAADRVSTTNVTLKKLTSSQVLTPILHTGTTTSDTTAVGTEILGGMWGSKKGVVNNMKELIDDYIKGDFWQVDQNFLRESTPPYHPPLIFADSTQENTDPGFIPRPVLTDFSSFGM